MKLDGLKDESEKEAILLYGLKCYFLENRSWIKRNSDSVETLRILKEVDFDFEIERNESKVSERPFDEKESAIVTKLRNLQNLIWKRRGRAYRIKAEKYVPLRRWKRISP